MDAKTIAIVVIVAAWLATILYFSWPAWREWRAKPTKDGGLYEQMRGRLKRGEKLTDEENLYFVQETLLRHGFVVDQEKLDHLADSLPGATDRQVDLYAGTVYTAETRGETVDRQIREQMLYGGDTPVDFPDGKGGRVLVLNGEVHQLDWCEPPPEDEAA